MRLLRIAARRLEAGLKRKPRIARIAWLAAGLLAWGQIAAARPSPYDAPTVSIGPPSPGFAYGDPVDFPVTYIGATTVSLTTGFVTLNATGTASGTVTVLNGATTTPTVRISSLTGKGTLGITLAGGAATDEPGNFDEGAGPSQTVTIRAVSLAWSSYMGGGNEDYSYGLTVDRHGNVFVAGQTASSGWVSGGYDTTLSGVNSTDAFVVKFSNSGAHLWSTYIGGPSFGERAWSLAVDGLGNVFVAGETFSLSSWVSGGYDTTPNGSLDAFVIKLSGAGAHLWSTYVGGSGIDQGNGLALDPWGNVCVTGHTGSSGWVSGGYDTTHNGQWDGFAVKISASGAHLWSTFLGGSAEDIGFKADCDNSGNVFVAGQTLSSGWTSGGYDTTYNGGYDGFVAKLSPSGAHLWSTYVGGASSELSGFGVAVSASGEAYVTGETISSGWVSGGFDTTLNGNYDAFVVKMSASGAHLWSTYLGGGDEDGGYGIATDGWGALWVGGLTRSSNWTAGGVDTSHNGLYDAFVARLSTAGDRLLWSSYVGGSGDDFGRFIGFGGPGVVAIAGETYAGGWASGGYNTTYGGAGDAFVASIVDEATSPTVSMFSAIGYATPTSPIPVTVAFSRPVSAFVAGDVSLSSATLQNFAGSGDTYSFDLVPSAEGPVTANIAAGVAQDSSGDDNTTASQFLRIYDVTPPATALSSTAPDPTDTSPIPVTVVFSEEVTGFAAGDVSLANATLQNFTGSGDTYAFDLVPIADGLVTADIASGVAFDSAGYGNLSATQFVHTYDTTPTVAMVSAAPDPTNESPIPVALTFSESVTGFEAGDVLLSNATLQNFSGSGDSYSFDMLPVADGLLTADIAGGVAFDGTGNANTAATQFVRIYDVTPPTVALSSAAPDPTTASPIPLSIDLSEPVTGFEVSDLLPTNAAADSFSGSGAAYSAQLTPLAQGTVTVSVPAGVAVDFAGNPNAASTLLTRQFDVLPVLSNRSIVPAVLIPGQAAMIGFDASEDLAATSTMTVNGHAASFAQQVGLHYEYSYTMSSADPMGYSLVEFNGADLTGNPVSFSDAQTLARAGIIYVDAAAPPGQSGDSWATALPTIQEALALASPTNDVWVAEGLYVPTGYGIELKDGVEVYGGFDRTETTPDDRDWIANPSYVRTPGIAYHGFTLVDIQNARLDGFFIRGADARGSAFDKTDRGGGIYCWNLDDTSTISQCWISYNFANNGGGGIYLENSNVAVLDCVFSTNYAGYGGGIGISGGAPRVERCKIVGNVADEGGGLRIYGTTSMIANCLIAGNLADEGGGLYSIDAAPIVSYCTVSDNTASAGGGLYIFDFQTGSVSAFQNCIVSNNDGYGIDDEWWNGEATLTNNCLFSGNSPADYKSYFYGLFDTGIYTGAAAINTRFILADQNIDGSPDYPPPTTGTWTADPTNVFTYDVTTFYDSAAAYTPGELLGRWLVPNAATGRAALITSNTATTIAAAGYWSDYDVPTGTAYSILDFHPGSSSAAIDTANPTYPSVFDVDRRARPVDFPGLGAEATGTEYDVGAYETPRAYDALCTPGSYDFGMRIIETGPYQTTLVLTNIGAATLTFGSPALRITGAGQADFQIGGGFVTTPLAPDESRIITVVFAPALSGAYAADLEVMSAETSPDPIVTVHLEGSAQWMPGVLWVRFDYAGTELGTYEQPYNTLGEAVQAVGAGNTARIFSGQSPVSIRITKAMRIEAIGGTVRLGDGGAGPASHGGTDTIKPAVGRAGRTAAGDWIFYN